MRQRTFLLLTGGLIVPAVAFLMIGKYRACLATRPETGCPALGPFIGKYTGPPHNILPASGRRQ